MRGCITHYKRGLLLHLNSSFFTATLTTAQFASLEIPLNITHQGKGLSIQEASQHTIGEVGVHQSWLQRGTHRRGNHTPQFGLHLPQEAATWDSIGENSPHTVTERLSYCRPLLWGAPGESFFLFFACSVCRFFRSCAWLYASDSPSLLEEGDTGICFQTMGMKGHDMLIMAR